MANNIAPEWPVNNDALWYCIITQKSAPDADGVTTDVPVTGLSDVEAFACATEELKDATPIDAGLLVALTNVSGSGVYYGYPNGNTAASVLIPAYNDTPVFIHFRSPSARWHEVARTIVRNTRTAT